jgi:hypothetical protein
MCCKTTKTIANKEISLEMIIGLTRIQRKTDVKTTRERRPPPPIPKKKRP